MCVNKLKNYLMPRARGRYGGFTLIEAMIAMTVLVISMSGIVAALLSCSQLRQLNEEKALVRNAADRVFSAIRGMPNIVDAYGRYGGGGAEEVFNIRGLQGPTPVEVPGRVIVWRRKSSLQNGVGPPQPDPGSALALSQAEILEAQDAFSNSFPNVMNQVAYTAGTAWDDYLDTNGDGAVNVVDEPQLMPVTVRIRWRRPAGGVTTQYFSAVIGRR